MFLNTNKVLTVSGNFNSIENFAGRGELSFLTSYGNVESGTLEKCGICSLPYKLELIVYNTNSPTNYSLELYVSEELKLLRTDGKRERSFFTAVKFLKPNTNLILYNTLLKSPSKTSFAKVAAMYRDTKRFNVYKLQASDNTTCVMDYGLISFVNKS